ARVDASKGAQAVPYVKLVSNWFTANDPGTKASTPWYSPTADDSAWMKSGEKTDFDSMNLSKFDGLVWYRKEVTTPDGAPVDGATLALGMIDDIDHTWVNGTFVGSLWAWNAQRRYTLPAGLLKPGRNVIAVRVLDTGGGGGLYSAP